MHISTKNKLKNFGLKNYCPICKSFVRGFKPTGLLQRKNALCPICNSMERHRLVWLYFKNEIHLFKNKIKMLHVAPENCFVRRLKNAENIDYYSIDIESSLADEKMSLTDLKYEENTFDFFYCSHVLEHIEDDKKALNEIYRVLKPDGKAVIMVPLDGEKTKEDLSIKDPKKREELYGQKDHVRLYGGDIKDKILDAGFTVELVNYTDSFSFLLKKWYGLINDSIFLLKK